MISPSSTKRRRKPGPWDADWERAQVKFARTLQRALGRMEKRVWAKIQKEARRRKALPDVPGDREFWAGEEAAWAGETSGGVSDLLLEGVTQAEALGLGVDFELANQQVLDYTRTYSNEWWGRMESSTREGLRTAIATNIETGAPLSSLRKGIAPIFGARRAEMVASTEVTRLFAEGNRIAYRDAGVMELEWRTVGDERVCDECEARDGERYPINDPGATPPLHVRCRCWIAPVVAGKPLTEPIPPPSELPLFPIDTPRIGSDQRYLLDNYWHFHTREARPVSEMLLKNPKMFKPGDELHKASGRLINMVRKGDKYDEIYRGMQLERGELQPLLDKWTVGSTDTLPLSSFTSEKKVADVFATRLPYGGFRKVEHNVMVTLRNARGADLNRYGSTYTSLEEVVSAGKVRVVEVTAGPIGKKKGTRIVLEAV